MRTELFLAGLIGLPMIGLPMIGGATGMAVAQESRYSSEWRAPTSAAASAQAPVDATTQQFVDELQALVDAAADANAADPRFLQDLRELALRYTWPWRTLVASDDFSDGNHTENPAWRVSRGTFTVEVGVGLRTAVAAATAESARSSGGSAASPEQLAVSILGALLSGNKASQSESSQPETVETAAAAGQINLDTTIPNAFALRAELSSVAGSTGRLEIGVAQGDGDLGYRLAYTPGAVLELLRYGSRGTGVIDTSTDPVTLEDGAVHLLQVTRSADGELVVTLDETVVMRATDRAFSGPFDRLVLINEGGDYTVRSVAVFGG